MPNAMGLRPGHEGQAGELRAVVGTYSQRVAAEDGRAVEQACDVLARDAPVHRDVHALVAEVVGHRQELDTLAVGQAIADEVHAPYFVDVFGQLQRHSL